MEKIFEKNSNLFQKKNNGNIQFRNQIPEKKNLKKMEQNNIFMNFFFFFCVKVETLLDNSERETLEDMRGSPITIGILEEKFEGKKAIVSTNNGFEFYVDVCSFVDISKLRNGDSVMLHGKTFSIVGGIKNQTNHLIDMMKVEIAPRENFSSIGGLLRQIREIKEVVELPINNPDIFLNIGIVPPKGVILYGEPGTGKTLIAKAVAHETKATFFRIGGSELVQKFLGDGPKLVREIFLNASFYTPSIIFIDEIDAIGTTRFDSFSGGEREIQRTMLELLNQLDGFDPKEDIKVIMATNRIDSLDPALIRPGRIDRKIEFPFPDEKTLEEIYKIHTKRMKIDKNFKLKNLLSEKKDLSGADVKAICTESALIALRNHRIKIKEEDLLKAKNSIVRKKREKFLEIVYG